MPGSWGVGLARGGQDDDRENDTSIQHALRISSTRCRRHASSQTPGLTLGGASRGPRVLRTPRSTRACSRCYSCAGQTYVRTYVRTHENTIEEQENPMDKQDPRRLAPATAPSTSSIPGSSRSGHETPSKRSSADLTATRVNY